jgi:hypothetical protein
MKFLIGRASEGEFRGCSPPSLSRPLMSPSSGPVALGTGDSRRAAPEIWQRRQNFFGDRVRPGQMEDRARREKKLGVV